MYRFESKYGTIYTQKADMTALEEALRVWELAHKKPEPPTRKLDVSELTWSQSMEANRISDGRHVSLSRAKQILIEKIGEVPDDKNEGYLAQKAHWEAKRWVFSEKILSRNYALVPVTINDKTKWMSMFDAEQEGLLENADISVLNKIRMDIGNKERTGECERLYLHIIRTSKLTYGAVLEAARKFWFKEKRQADTRMHPRRWRRKARHCWTWLARSIRDWHRSKCVLRYGCYRTGEYFSDMAMQELACVL